MKSIFLSIKIRLELFLAFLYDFKCYVASSYKTTRNRKDAMAVPILLTMHQLEKGMSMKLTPREFGGDKAIWLVNALKEYIIESDYDQEIFIAAINILGEYIKDPWSVKDKSKRNVIENFIIENKAYVKDNFAGVKIIEEPKEFDKKAIVDFFQSRSSVREYSEKSVTIEEIRRAVDFAKVTPSACNRQSCRVHYYNDPGTMKLLIENQLGDQGWCNNAKGIIVVTSDQSYFGGCYERSQALIDGGLYAMNLVYGLHYHHIASCFKMFVREIKREMEFKKIANIPSCEIPIVLILVGHYKASAIVEPKSVRFNPRISC